MSTVAKKDEAGKNNAEGSERPRKKKSVRKIPTKRAAARHEKKMPITLHVFRELEFFRDLPDATFVIDNHGTVLVWNRAMEGLTGFSAAEILGKGDFCYAIPFYGERRPILIDVALDPATRLPEVYDNLCCDGRVVTATTRYARPKGENVILWKRASPIIDENGTILGAIESIRDITLHKQMKDQLRASEERFRALAENASDIIRIFDREGKIVFDTAASEHILGYPPGFSLGKDPFEFIHPEDAGTVKRELSSVYEKTNSGVPTEFRIRKADGSYVWAESVGKNMFGVPGIDGIVTATRFIDERKKAEVALLESEERYRTFLSHSNEGIFRFEAGCDIPFNLPTDEQIALFVEHAYLAECNDAFARMYGYEKAEELIGVSIDHIMDIDNDNTLEYIRMFIRSGYGVENFESVEKDRYGNTRWFSNSLTGILQDGKVIRLWGVQRDITERKKAEQQMEESEAKFRTLFEGAGDAIFIMNSTVFMDCNQSTEVIFGCSRNQIIGHSPAEFSPERQPDGQLSTEKAKEKIDAALSGEPQVFEWVHVRYDRTPFNAEVTLSQVMLNDDYCLQAIVRDITERRKADEALRESESRYSALFTNNYSISLLIDPDTGRIVDANDAAARYYGYSHDQLTVMGIYDLNRLDKRIVVKNLIRAKEEGAKHFFSAHYLASGEKHNVEIYSGPITVHGKPLFYSIIHDITHRKKAEQELQESKDLYQTLADSSPDMIYLIDKKGYIRFANSLASRQFRMSPADLIGKKLDVFFAPHVAQSHMEGITRVIMTGEPMVSELFESFPFGECWIHVRLNPVKDATGEVTHILGISSNITDRKLAEKALRESEARYRTLIDQLPDYVIVHCDGIILYANPAAARDIRYEGTALIGKPMMEFVDPKYNEVVKNATIRRIAGEIVAPYEIVITVKDGSKRTTLINGAQIVFEGKPAILNVLTDISIQKAAEDFMQRAKEALEERVAERTWELTQANEQLADEIKARNHAERIIKKSLDEKDLLLREIHHRVKNNLQIIASLLNLQSRYITDNKALETIRDSQNRVRAMALVHERIYLSHEIATINVAEYLRYLINQLFQFYNIPQTQVEVSVTIDEISADIDTAIPIGLIINELVSNALKHAFPEGRKGKITVKGTQPAPDQLQFVFRDNGIGMPADYDWKNTNSLGLRLVKSLTVQLMGTVEMEQDGGTVYTITVKPRNLIRRKETEETYG